MSVLQVSERQWSVCFVSAGGKALPELLDLLRQGPSGAHDSDDNLALACQIASCLITKEPERNKKHVNSSLIKSLTDLSENR